MKIAHVYLFIALIAFLLASCDKDDCKERNQNSVSYSVQDSVLIAISQEWQQQSYILEVITCENNPDWMQVLNLGNADFEVEVNRENCDFSVTNGSTNESSWDDIDCSGTISETTIHFEYAWTNSFGEPFIGRGAGNKQ